MDYTLYNCPPLQEVLNEENNSCTAELLSKKTQLTCIVGEKDRCKPAMF